MPRCVVRGCSNKSYGKSKSQLNFEKFKKITFHRFPKDEENKLTWMKSLGIENELLSTSTTVCSTHFEDSAFYNSLNYQITRLRENAVPIKIVATDKTKTEEHITGTSNTSQVKPATESATKTITTYKSKTEENVTGTSHTSHLKLPNDNCKETITSDKSKTEEHITGTSNTPATDSGTTGSEFGDISNSSIDQNLLETTDEEMYCSDDDSNVKGISPCASFDHDYVTNQLEVAPKEKYMRKDFKNENRERLCTSLDHDYVGGESKDTSWKIYMRKALVEQKRKYEKKISILMQQTRRQKKRIATLSAVLKECKKRGLTLDEHADFTNVRVIHQVLEPNKNCVSPSDLTSSDVTTNASDSVNNNQLVELPS